MNFEASPAALARNEEDIRPVTNWTLRRNRYRMPTDAEADLIGVGTSYPSTVSVVNDEGLFFINDGATIHVFTTAELGI